MRYIKGQMVVEAQGGFRVLESMGYKSEWDVKAEEREREKSKINAAYWASVMRYKKTCPICEKEYTTTNSVQVCCSRPCGIESRRRKGWKRVR